MKRLLTPLVAAARLAGKVPQPTRPYEAVGRLGQRWILLLVMLLWSVLPFGTVVARAESAASGSSPSMSIAPGSRQWRNPLPLGATLSDAACLESSTCLILGDRGTIQQMAVPTASRARGACRQASAVGTPNPKALSLPLKDLPAGFYIKSSQFSDASALAKATKPEQRAELAKACIVSLYYVFFERKPLKGMYWVISSVMTFTSTAAAGTFFDRYPDSGTQPPLVPMSVERIGTMSRGWRGEIGDPGKAPVSTEYDIGFVRGPYVVYVVTLGVLRSYSDQQAIKLAHFIDGRILRHGA